MIVPERVMKSGRVCPAFQIDDDLAPKLLRLKWITNHEGYLVGSYHRKSLRGRRHISIRLHRAVFHLRHGRPARFEVDHINRDKLDNRSANLREATNQENIDNGGGRPRIGANAHLPKAVYWNPKCCPARPYQVNVWAQSKLRHVGYFATIEQAVEARDRYLESIKEVQA